jgi:2-iminoacetate synthase
MAYLPGMEVIESDLKDRVRAAMAAYDPTRYTAVDVRRALEHNRISIDDLQALLSPAAAPFLERMAERARAETVRHFGNTVYIFTPLYIANHCENYCVYCGFNCYNPIRRMKLDKGQIEREMEIIAKSGMEEILLLTGESRSVSGVEYIGDACELARKYFRLVGLEVYPMNTDEYRYLRGRGADYVTVFQETYDVEQYEKLHLQGHKRVWPYRFDAQERALMGGMRGVAFGALLGLDDFRKDALRCGLHASELQRRYPHAEISLSLPRLRPFKHHEDERIPVGERELLQVSLAYRIFMPYAGQTISTRERPGFRDGIIGLSATKMSAGVSVGIGEHSGSSKGDGQFVISDPRDLEEIVGAIRNAGLQPVMNDYVRT